jgi:rhodanese-related sulfurtransferase
VSPAKAKEMVESGDWLIMDVRTADTFDKASVEGAVNVPLFQGVNFSQITPKSFLRAVAFTLNGVKAVEPNPNFDDEVKAKSGGQGVILVCISLATLTMLGCTARHSSGGRQAHNAFICWLPPPENMPNT